MQVEGLEGVEIVRYGVPAHNEFHFNGAEILNCPCLGSHLVVKPADGFCFEYDIMLGGHRASKSISPTAISMRKVVNSQKELDTLKRHAEMAGFEFHIE